MGGGQARQHLALRSVDSQGCTGLADQWARLRSPPLSPTYDSQGSKNQEERSPPLHTYTLCSVCPGPCANRPAGRPPPCSVLVSMGYPYSTPILRPRQPCAREGREAGSSHSRGVAATHLSRERLIMSCVSANLGGLWIPCFARGPGGCFSLGTASLDAEVSNGEDGTDSAMLGL